MIFFVLLAIIPFLASATQTEDGEYAETFPDDKGHVPHDYTGPEMHEVVDSIGHFCVNMTGATMEELQLIYEYKKMSTTRASKCLVSCMLVTLRTVSLVDLKNSFISNESMNLYISATFKPEHHDTVLEAWTECGKKVIPVPDVCEHIFAVTQCYMDVLEEINVKPIPVSSVKEVLPTDNP